FYTGAWLSEQDLVAEVAFTNSYIVHITFTDGLRGNLLFLPVDEEGRPIYRGAPDDMTPDMDTEAAKMATYVEGMAGEEEKIIIENKKVLVFNPEAKQFYSDNYSEPLNIMDGAIKDLDVTVVNNEAAGISQIEEFYKYGLVIINSHGIPG